MEQNKHGTLEQIKAVWDHWNHVCDPVYDAPTTMVEIGNILVEHEIREKRLRAISDAARKEREAKNGLPEAHL